MSERKELARQITNLNNKLHALKLKPKGGKKNHSRNRVKMQNASKPVTTYEITKNVQRSGKTNKRVGKALSPYGSCRLNPFSGMSVSFSGLPDGDNSKRIVLDHVAFTDFSFTSGSATFRVMAGLPFNVLAQFAPTTNVVATDPTIGTFTTTSYGDSNANVWLPTNVPAAYSQQINIVQALNTSTIGPYAQTKCRCIGLAWRIIYTGTVSNASGLLSIRDFATSVDNEVGLGTGVIALVKPNNNVNINSPYPIQSLVMDFPSQTSSNDVGNTRFLRLDQNPWGVAKHNSQLYSWKTYREQPFILISSAYSLSTIAAANIRPLITQGANEFNLGFNLIDDEFNCTEIKMSNVTSPISFRLETRACWEYIVQPTSPVYSLTKVAGPRNQSQLNQVEVAIQKSPAGLAFNETLHDPRK